MSAADEPNSSLEPTDEVIDGEIAEEESGQRRLLAERQEFSGPLPAPHVLREYEDVKPGLADIIVSQWQQETTHRHSTIDGLRQTDHEAMQRYYEGERQGQWIGLGAFIALLAVIVVALILGSDVGAIGGLIVAGAYAIWALRRRSSPAPMPQDLADDEIEMPLPEKES